MSPIEKLLAAEEIRSVKARYWRSMDRRLWDEFEQCFTDDCVFDVRFAFVEPPIGRMPAPNDSGYQDNHIFRGAKVIREYVEKGLVGVRSVHQGHIPEIDLLSSTEANAIFPFEDVLEFPEGTSPRYIRGYGHYHEEYRQVDGHWCISKSTIYRLMINTCDNDIR